MLSCITAPITFIKMLMSVWKGLTTVIKIMAFVPTHVEITLAPVLLGILEMDLTVLV